MCARRYQSLDVRGLSTVSSARRAARQSAPDSRCCPTPAAAANIQPPWNRRNRSNGSTPSNRRGAEDRKSVVSGKSVSDRVKNGGCQLIQQQQKKKNNQLSIT